MALKNILLGLLVTAAFCVASEMDYQDAKMMEAYNHEQRTAH